MLYGPTKGREIHHDLLPLPILLDNDVNYMILIAHLNSQVKRKKESRENTQQRKESERKMRETIWQQSESDTF